MTPPDRERGAALLTVLLLVAVMATIAATALDRIAVATHLSANAAVAAQARQWLGMAEQLAAARIEDLLVADRSQTIAGPWLDQPRTIALPDGGIIRARVRDGGNCFNLNSLATESPAGALVSDPRAVGQFRALMVLLGVDGGSAARVAASAADWVDSDASPQPDGSEGASGAMPPNSRMADPSELRSVPGMTPAHYALIAPFLCALPVTEPVSLNVNTLRPEQAPLLAMLAPEQIGLDRARAHLAERPASGFGSVVNFWQSGAFAGITPPAEAAAQVKVRSAWFLLQTEVSGGGIDLAARSLIDARSDRARIVSRAYGSPS